MEPARAAKSGRANRPREGRRLGHTPALVVWLKAQRGPSPASSCSPVRSRWPPMQQPRYASDEEIRLARMWKQDGVAVAEIARRLKRHESSVWRVFKRPAAADASRGVGRRRKLSDADTDRLLQLVYDMVETADTKYEVTVLSLQKRFRPKVCVRVLANALHSRGVRFHRLREKPILTDRDVEERFAWSKRYRKKAAAWWQSAVGLHIDNRVFKLPATAASRRRLAARRVRGADRLPGKSLQRSHVRAGRGLRQNSGGRGVCVCGGVGAGRVLLWHVVEGKWNKKSAADAVRGPIKAALAKGYPRKRKFIMLEDNDPTGYKSTDAGAAKAAAKIQPFRIPPRSPDLNVMDYFLWTEMQKRLRAQERKWGDDRRETRAQFIRRLRCTAARLPADLINRAIGDLARRAEGVCRAKSGLIEEGGRSAR